MKFETDLRSILATSAHGNGHGEGLSDKHSFISSMRVIEIFEDNGYAVVDAQETQAKKGDGFQKHILRFRHESLLDSKELVPEALMMNAHDGHSAFIIGSAMFVFVCSNGIIVSRQTVAWHKILHLGYTDAKVQSAIDNVLEATPRLTEAVKTFCELELTQPQRTSFANNALDMLYPNSKKWETFDKTMSAKNLLTPRRNEDTDKNLWSTFNVVQEKFTRGGSFMQVKPEVQSAKNYTNIERVTQPIREIDRNVNVNTGLWDLAVNTAIRAKTDLLLA